MKHRDIQRSVRGVRVDRSAGDAPSIGRVSRVPGTGLAKKVRRRRKRRDGEREEDSADGKIRVWSRRSPKGRGNRLRNNRKKVILTWSISFMILALGSLVVALWFWLRPTMDKADEVLGEIEPVAKIDERVASEFPSPTEDEALALVKRAMLVRDPSKVTEVFRCGTSQTDEIISFLRKMERIEGPISDYEWLSSMDTNGMLLDGVKVSMRSVKGVRNRLALLTPDEKGVWRVDFDAFARKVSPPWSDLLAGKADHSMVRVFVSPDSYFNGLFKDETVWECYGVVSPDNEEVLLGYCKKGSPQADAMKRIVSSSEDLLSPKPVSRATLELRRVEGAESRQFEIARVYAEGWVISPTPFDGGVK